MSMSRAEGLAARTPRETPNISNSVLKQFDLAGQVCIVTGASRGIGFAVSEAFAEASATVILVSSTKAYDIDRILADMTEQYGVKAVHRQCDVSNPAKIQALIAEIKELFGRIDVFVANAGVCVPKSIFEESLEEYHAQMNVNVHGVYCCAKYVGLVFKQQGYGKFIITSSISGRVVTVPLEHTTYNTTKAAVTHLGRSLAHEWRDFARVNIVSPGWIDTSMSDDKASVNEACRMAVMGRLGIVRTQTLLP